MLVQALVLLVLLGFPPAALEPGREELGGVGADLGAEQVDGVREPVVDVLLDRLEIDAADLAGVAVLAGELGRPTEDALQAGLADVEVVGLFGQLSHIAIAIDDLVGFLESFFLLGAKLLFGF